MTSRALELRTFLRKRGVNASDEALLKLEGFVAELLRMNKRVNLISRKDEENIWDRHIVHSLSLLWTLSLPSEMNVLDLGTGGGLPGIPLSMLMPQSRFVLLDATAKKIDAVSSMIDSLGLTNVRAVWGRAEDIGKKNEFGKKFQIVVARAVASLEEVIRYAMPFLEDPGPRDGEMRGSGGATGSSPVVPPAILAFKGGELESELKAARRLKEVRSVISLPISGQGIETFDHGQKKIVVVEVATATEARRSE